MEEDTVVVVVVVVVDAVIMVEVFEVLHHSYAMQREVLDSVNIVVAVAAERTKRDWWVPAMNSCSVDIVTDNSNKHC